MAINYKGLDLSKLDPKGDGPFFEREGETLLRFDDIEITMERPGTVRMSFSWKGKPIHYYDMPVPSTDHLSVVLRYRGFYGETPIRLEP